MFYSVLIILAIGTLSGLNHIQKVKYRRGMVPKKSELLCRSRWAIILLGIGVFSCIIPIRDFQERYHAQEVENSLRLDTIEIKYFERIPMRHFQEGLYSREELDVLEADYRDLGAWMDDNAVELHKKMKDYGIIEVESLSMPVPKSVIGDGDLTYYRESFLKAIYRYNQDVEVYNKVQHKIYVITVLSMILNYLMPIVIIIAMALQLNVVFWNYHEPPKNTKEAS